MDVAIVGIGLHPFGRHPDMSGLDQGDFAVRQALRDASVGFSDLQFGFGGSHAAGDADSLVGRLGLTGLPVINVANGCAVGGSALLAASQAIRSGDFDLGFVVGFDKHPRGAFNVQPASLGLGDWYGETGMMLTTQFFAMKVRRYLHDHEIEESILAEISAKSFRNGSRNPNAWRREELSPKEIAEAPMVNPPLTKYMFCAPGEGAVALILCRGERAHLYSDRPVYLRAATMKSRRYGSFEVYSPWLSPTTAPSPSVDAATAAYEEAGVGPDEIHLAQIQDTDAGAELMHMAECGLAEHGEQPRMIAHGDTEIGGCMPINTDGGCIANGEPIGASGLRQVYENVLQIRGDASGRQVPGDPRTAFSHVYGAPGVSACTIVTR